MTTEEFNNLEIGDKVRHRFFEDASYIITSNYGEAGMIGVKTSLLVNPEEWILIKKAPRDDKH